MQSRLKQLGHIVIDLQIKKTVHTKKRFQKLLKQIKDGISNSVLLKEIAKEVIIFFIKQFVKWISEK